MTRDDKFTTLSPLFFSSVESMQTLTGLCLCDRLLMQLVDVILGIAECFVFHRKNLLWRQSDL